MLDSTTPGAGRPPREPVMQRLTWAVTYTGMSRKTLMRRMNAWESGLRTPYALKGGRAANNRNDRRIDMIDAERIRLQDGGRLDPEVTTETWRTMVFSGQVPREHVTEDKWFQDLLPEQ